MNARGAQQRLIAFGLAAGCAFGGSAPRAADPPPVEPPPVNDVRKQIFEHQSAGVRALRQGDGRTAVEQLCWAMERALNSHDAAWYCGQARLLIRDPEAAIVALEFASDLDPHHLAGWVDLGDAYAGAGRTDRARAAYHRALELRRDHAPAFDGLGRLAAALGDDAGALEQFAKAIEANAADARVLLHRGQFHLSRARYELALTDIRAAATLRPDDPQVQDGLARVLVDVGLFDDALAAVRRARQLRPQDPSLAALEAEVFRRLGAHEEAADLAQVSLALDPNAAEPRLTLARALAALGRIDAAIAALAAPDPTRLYEAEQRALATLRAELEQRRAELLRAEAAAASGGGDPALVLDAAAARLAGGDRAGAVALARAVLPQLGADPALVRRAALVLGRAGRWLEAEPLWEGLTRAAAAGARDWFNLGLTREQTGDPAGAGAAYREALQAPDAVTVAADLQAGLARLAWSAGDVPTTIAALEAYLAADPPADQAARTREVLRRLRPAPEAAR